MHTVLKAHRVVMLMQTKVDCLNDNDIYDMCILMGFNRCSKLLKVPTQSAHSLIATVLRYTNGVN